MSAAEAIRKIDEARAAGKEVAAKWYLREYLRAKAQREGEQSETV